MKLITIFSPSLCVCIPVVGWLTFGSTLQFFIISVFANTTPNSTKEFTVKAKKLERHLLSQMKRNVTSGAVFVTCSSTQYKWHLREGCPDTGANRSISSLYDFMGMSDDNSRLFVSHWSYFSHETESLCLIAPRTWHRTKGEINYDNYLL